MSSSADMLKIAIRGDGPTVRAFIATIDGKNRTEFATVSRHILDERPDLRDTWMSLVTEAGRFVIEEATGLEVADVTHHDPADLEEDPQA